MQKVAIVTGANRGLGRATATQLARQGMHVIFCGRSEEQLKTVIGEIKDEGFAIEAFILDVTDRKSVNALAEYVSREFGHLDVLVNNAGIFNESSGPMDRDQASIFRSAPEKVLESFKVNALGALHLMQAMEPLLKKAEAARVVNVSSGMGQHSEMGSHFPGYRMSKASMNVLTQVAAIELEGTKVKVNSVCPGWVRTDMGGQEAVRSLDEGIAGITWAATLPDDGPTGGFFRDGKALDW